jgi:hypothetical protein
MTLKSAALFAWIGMALLSLTCAVGVANDITALAAGAIPLVTALSAVIHLLANLSLTVFLYVFYRAQ